MALKRKKCAALPDAAARQLRSEPRQSKKREHLRDSAKSENALAPDFETFFRASLNLLVISDAGLKIVKVNQTWERMLGYKAEELEGQPMLSFVHPDDVAASYSQMQRIETERDVKGIINRYRCKDGGYR